MAAVDTDTLRKLMRDLGDEPAVMQELIDTFLAEAPRTMAELTGSLNGPDRRTMNRCVHSLRSTAATFGARELSRLCRDLEADTERDVPADAAARVARIEAEWGLVRAEIAAWRP